jgi:hypothetical protein
MIPMSNNLRFFIYFLEIKNVFGVIQKTYICKNLKNCNVYKIKIYKLKNLIFYIYFFYILDF